MTKGNKIHAIVYTVLGLAVIFLAVMWGRCAMAKKKLDVEVTNNYDRAFFELSDYVGEIDVLLTKAQLASTPAQLASIASEIFMQSAEAKSCFGQLPEQDINLENTAQFLSQVGDYTYVLSQNMINGQGITDEEYEMLAKLNEYASSLSDSLKGIETKIYNGEINFSTAEDVSAVMSVFAQSDILKDLEDVEKSFEGYPSLIYDGPFSEHIENRESPMLKDANLVSEEEARRNALDFLGKDKLSLEMQGEMTNTAVECYLFGSATEGRELSVAVTKKGGYVLYFIDSRGVDKANLGIDEATQIASEYLMSHGYDSMVNSYYEVTNNIATINFAYSQNGVKMYSDLIKVRVALDTGEVIGIEAKGYLMNHRMRDIAPAVLSEAEAQASVSKHLVVNAVSLAVIPKDSMREVLCYEFHGTYNDKNFIIYINAENGREEEILLLIESETGILTI